MNALKSLLNLRIQKSKITKILNLEENQFGKSIIQTHYGFK